MTKHNDIIKLANFFYRKAYNEKEAQFAYFFKSFMNRIAKLAEGCIASSQHLLSYQQYQDSQGLKNISIQMPRIMNAAKSADATAPEQSSNLIAGLIGGLTFHTGHNAGTGADSVTSKTDDNVTPPSYYVNTINSLINQVQVKVKERQKEQTVNSQNVS